MNAFFNIALKWETYVRIFYLLFSFPLSILYFVFLVVGLALGFGLFITWFGIPILIGVLYACTGLAALERYLTGAMLDMDIHYKVKKGKKVNGIWKNLKKFFALPTTWTNLFYLLFKFPLGVISFVAVVVSLCVSLSFFLIPFLYILNTSGIIAGDFLTINGVSVVNNFGIALFLGVFGFFSFLLSLHILNGLAILHGKMAQLLLSSK